MPRVGFVTCVQLGLSCMEAIYEAGGHLVFAGTLRDDRGVAKSGRIYLDDFCARHAIALAKFGNINDPEAIEAIRAANLDWLFIVGWSQIARSGVLQATRRGVLGIHPTLLPVGRGRAPVPWAILLGLEETGVTLFQLDEGVDSGPIAAQVRVPLAPRETATELYRKIVHAHRDVIHSSWPALMAGSLQLTPQDEAAATIWEARSPAQGRLDPMMSVAEADRLVRAVTHPYPGAFIDIDGRRLRVWAAHPDSIGKEIATANVDLAAPGARIAFRDGVLTITAWNWEELT
jgi:methionyl-tRNA formyltransferase